MENLIGSLHHLSKFQPIVCLFHLVLALDHKMALNRKRMMFDFFVKSKKNTKTTGNDGGERQETTSTASS